MNTETLVRTATGEMVSAEREAAAVAVYDAVYTAPTPREETLK